MSHKRVMFWVLLLMAACGLLESRAVGLRFPVGLAVSYLCFAWYRGDSEARGFLRSRWMSVGVVAFTAGAIPYYLLRSRKEGERGQALLVYAAYMALVVLAVWVGDVGWGGSGQRPEPRTCPPNAGMTQMHGGHGVPTLR
jgi:hypothetical protein